jgi:uncharacterized tellurite resistance protein B-like protein
MAIADLASVLRIFSGSSSGGESQEDLFKEVLLMVLARASSSDANINPVEIENIQEIMKRETDQDLTEADIRKAARAELYEDANLRKYLRSVQRQLRNSDRIKIAQALADVIRSDTRISGLEIDFFNRVAEALQLTPAQLVGLSA